jgi:hypothetical protein
VVRIISMPPSFVNEKIKNIQFIRGFRCFLNKLADC